MACKFCPKVKRGDLLFIVVSGLAFYGVYTYQMHQVQQAQEEKHTQDFKKLQESCVLHHDKQTCQEVFKPGSKEPQR